MIREQSELLAFCESEISSEYFLSFKVVKCIHRKIEFSSFVDLNIEELPKFRDR